jgi:hypothetical protein
MVASTPPYQRDAPERRGAADHCSNDSQETALDELQAPQIEPIRSEAGPQGDFAASAKPPGEEQERDVRAGNQRDEACAAEKQRQRAPDPAEVRFLERRDID